MDYDNTEKDVRVQGRDTPVPVRAMSGRAGSPGPSASDCSVISVESQADDGLKATGSAMEVIEGDAVESGRENENPFIPRKRTSRTPPKRNGRCNSLPDPPGEKQISGDVPKRPGDVGNPGNKPKVPHASKVANPAIAMPKQHEQPKKVMDRRNQLAVNLVGMRSHSAPTSPLERDDASDLAWDAGQVRSTKRRREDPAMPQGLIQDDDTERLARTAAELARIIDSINKETGILVEVAKERNTRREVKEAAGALKGLIAQLRTDEIRLALQSMGTKPTEGSSEVAALKEKIQNLEKSNKELRVQNSALRREIKERGQPERLPLSPVNNMEEGMFTVEGSYEQFVKLQGLRWPNNIFQVVSQTVGSPLTADREMDLVMLKEKGHQRNVRTEKAILERYPELHEVDSKVAAISVTTKAIKNEGKEVQNERWVLKMEIVDEEKDYYNCLVELREILKKGGRTKVAMYPPENDLTGTKTRKMVEYIFRGSGVDCQLYTQNTGREPIRPSQIGNRRGDALILNHQGNGYAETLKRFKEKVKPGSALSNAIRTIRESKNGNMVVVLEKNCQEEAEALRKEVTNMGELRLVRDTRINESTLYINEIDAVTTREEVLAALCRETGLDERAVRVSELRKSFGSYQTAIVNISKEKGELLLERESIKIGLSRCLIKERVEVRRCYRCWQYDHLAKDCKVSEDASKLCRKCGEEAHLARDCTNEERCLTCKQRGHTAGSGRCPEFRKAVRRERLRSKKKKSY